MSKIEWRIFKRISDERKTSREEEDHDEVMSFSVPQGVLLTESLADQTGNSSSRSSGNFVSFTDVNSNSPSIRNWFTPGNIESREDVYIVMNDQIGLKKRGSKKELEVKLCLHQYKNNVPRESINNLEDKVEKTGNLPSDNTSRRESTELGTNVDVDPHSTINGVESQELVFEEWKKYKLKKKFFQSKKIKKKEQLRNLLQENNLYNEEIEQMIQNWKQITVEKHRQQKMLRWKEECIMMEETRLNVSLKNDINSTAVDSAYLEQDEREFCNTDQEIGRNKVEEQDSTMSRSQWISWCVEGPYEIVQDFLLFDKQYGKNLRKKLNEKDVLHMGYPQWIATLPCAV